MTDVYFRLFIQDQDGIHDTDEDLTLAYDFDGVAPSVGDVVITSAGMRGHSTFTVVRRIQKAGGEIGLVLEPEVLSGPLRNFCGQ